MAKVPELNPKQFASNQFCPPIMRSVFQRTVSKDPLKVAEPQINGCKIIKTILQNVFEAFLKDQREAEMKNISEWIFF